MSSSPFQVRIRMPEEEDSQVDVEDDDAHWLAIGGTFTVASGNELTKPRQNMKVKKEPLAFFQSLSRSIMH